MNTTKIVELVIDEDSQELAIDAISLVSAPAIEENWVFFGKEKNNLTFAKVISKSLGTTLILIQITMFILVLKQYVRLLNYI